MLQIITVNRRGVIFEPRACWNGRSDESVISAALIYLSPGYYGARKSVAICLSVKLLNTTLEKEKANKRRP